MSGIGRARRAALLEPRATAPLLDVGLLGRHQIAAAIATTIDFAAMVALVELLHAPPPVATLASSIAGGVTNFALGRAWSFRARHRGSFASQAARYAVVCVCGALLNASLLGALLAATSNAPYVLARVALSILVSVAYTYPMHTKFVFRVVNDTETGDSR